MLLAEDFDALAQSGLNLDAVLPVQMAELLRRQIGGVVVVDMVASLPPLNVDFSAPLTTAVDLVSFLLQDSRVERLVRVRFEQARSP